VPRLKSLLALCPADEMICWPVSPRVVGLGDDIIERSRDDVDRCAVLLKEFNASVGYV
jgi:hypothetical protein